jgi:threonine aldolase
MVAPRHDFRSDTVTKPTAEMRAAMAAAEVGDDVYGDDPTVTRLQETLAKRVGMEAALFVPSGTQSNLLALMAHCGRGEAFIAGQNAHLYRYEAGGAAVLGSLQPQPIEHAPDGSLPIEKVEAAITGGGDPHFAETRLIALENTIGGQVLSLAYMRAISDLARAHGVGMHLDGARAFNAAIKLGVDIDEVAAPFDSISICLSKGLGAPVGSVLCGSSALIATARRLRKMLGGGMRQAGILAAAGIYALDHHVDRLAQDHQRAHRLAVGLARHDALRVKMPDTNIIFVDAEPAVGDSLRSALAEAGVGVTGRYGQQRWVTHLDIKDDDVTVALDVVDRYFG